MFLSVVINTYNRAESLKITLESLKYQTCKDFEVVVVNGPSTDNTLEILAPFKHAIKLINCNERNLSVSRNLGIEASSGDIVAFIDDDAIADPNWVRDLLAGYDNDDVGGVGGLVYDHTGMKLQYKYSACDRKGDTDFTINRPFDRYNNPGTQKFLYLQGTNCSFRRKCLVEIGGFDEEFEYYLDEVDVCMRIIDLGYKIKPLDNAIVHHKYMKSFLRNDKKVVLHPYSTVKNKYYFAYQNANIDEIKTISECLEHWLTGVKDGGNWNLNQGNMTEEELKVYLEEVETACTVGRERGKGAKKNRQIHTNEDNKFLPFCTIKEPERRLKICYISREYPPENFGGIGRYTYDLATTFASFGHEVHVITEGKFQDTIDFEDGVWVHRLINCLYKPVENLALGWNISLMLRNYFEVKRINDVGKIDIINGPIWLCETGFCNNLLNIPVVVTLMTTQKILNQLTHKSEKDLHEFKLMKMEEITLKQHKYIHAISESIKENCKDSINEESYSFIAPLGCRDLNSKYEHNRKDENIRILSVGRLEERKGTDILLEAAAFLIEKYDYIDFVFAGKDTNNTPSGVSYKKIFQEKYKNNEKILKHVYFLGEISEKDLMQSYKNADICCTPSRYESFGIVLLEGMSFNNAIVAANIGGMKGIIEDKINGLLFESGNVKDLIEKLSYLIKDKILRDNLAEQARKDYNEKYSLDAVYHNLYSQYIRIIDNYEENTIEAKDACETEKIAQLISYSESIPIDEAKNITQLLLDSQEVYSNIIPKGKDGILKKQYYYLKKCSPNLAYKLKNLFFPYYLEMQGKGNKSKIAISMKCFYHCLKKLPLVGIIIRYIGDIILFPLKVEKIGTFVFDKNVNLKENIDFINLRLEKSLAEISDIHEITNYLNQSLEQNSQTIIKHINVNLQKVVKENKVLKEYIDNTLDSIEKRIDTSDAIISDYILDMMTSSLKNMNCCMKENNEQLNEDLFLELQNVKNIILDNDALIEEISKITEIRNNEANYKLDDVKNVLYDSLSDRLMMIRSEILFEINRNISHKDIREVKTKIINNDKIDQMKKNNYIALNLGAGHICLEEYINVDERELTGIDLVADVRNLPFEEKSINKIYASHIIEHFMSQEFSKEILPYWTRLLKTGGKIEIILPDLESMMQNYNDKIYRIEDFREVIYGLQEYPGDVHYALYGRNELENIFVNCGYKTKYEFVNRHNGKCYDMKLTGVKI